MMVRAFWIAVLATTLWGTALSDSADAANNNAYFPSSQAFGKLLFEDQFPCQADYDFNDLVVEYNATVVTDSTSDDMLFLVWNTRVAAVGGRINNGFAVELPYLNSDIASVEGATWENNGATEKVVLRLFENGHAEFGASGSLNTDPNREDFAPVELSATIRFNSSVSVSGTPPYNAFAFRTDTRSHEIHFKGESPTSLGANFDGVCDVGSSYSTSAGLPFALHVVDTGFDWAMENTRIDDAYPNLVTWASSNGVDATDWHETPVVGTTQASSLAAMSTLTASSCSYTASSVSVLSSHSTAVTNSNIAAQIASEFVNHPKGIPQLMDWRDIEAMTAVELATFMTTSPTTTFVTKDGDIDLYAGRPYFIRRIEGYTNPGAAIHDAVWLDLNDPTDVTHWTSGSVAFPDATGKRGFWLGSWNGARPAMVVWQ